jgi:hypothetical protein
MSTDTEIRNNPIKTQVAETTKTIIKRTCWAVGAIFLLGVCLIQIYYQSVWIIARQRKNDAMEEAIALQRLDLRSKIEDIALKDAEIEALQSEVACLTEELEEMRQSWVPRSTVQMIDDVPTRSMKEICYKMALAWKDAFAVLKKVRTDLEERKISE